MGRLENKVAIVTGAGSGIGKAIAQCFAREGARVVVADIAAASAAAREIGGEALGLDVDVSSDAAVRSMIERTLAAFHQLDILVNNAGIEGEQAPTADCSVENFDRVIAVNLRGAFLGMKYAIPAMLQDGGSIINVASVAGLVGFPGLPAYCASKGGMIQLTKAAALEYATRKIRVNAICPGVIMTPMIERFTNDSEEGLRQMEQMEPVGRLGTPEEVAALALFLAGEESSFITGTALPVDGGLVAR